MKKLILGPLVLLMAIFGNSCIENSRDISKINYDTMIIRIAEIEIDSLYLDEYISILKEESEASVRLEPGVICIYPMFQKENPTQIRLLEIYSGEDAYASHLETPHFKHYKTTTQKMVKSLKLVDMESIDAETMAKIFKKLDQ